MNKLYLIAFVILALFVIVYGLPYLNATFTGSHTLTME